MNSRFLVLSAGLFCFTVITGHKYFSPLEPASEFTHQKILYEWILILNIFVFVKQNIYILLHACSATMRFLRVHSWVDARSAYHAQISLWYTLLKFDPYFSFICLHHSTGRKVAKLNKFSSAYQLANIQIYCAD